MKSIFMLFCFGCYFCLLELTFSSEKELSVLSAIVLGIFNAIGSKGVERRGEKKSVRKS